MNEQQQEYGIDYAMHRHDIGEICEMDNVLAVNKHLKEGRVLLSIKQDGDYPVYIMGVPRPKFCDNWRHKHEHTEALTWHHETKRWTCKECDYIEALDDDACWRYQQSVDQQPQTDSD